MKLTKKVEYALMGLYFLAYVRPHSHVQVRTVAEEVRVPKRFLEQIFLTLREEGILESRRGSQGGYALSVPTREITLALLFRILEGAGLEDRRPLGGSGAERFAWNAHMQVWDAFGHINLDTLMTSELKEYLRTGTDSSMLYYI